MLGVDWQESGKAAFLQQVHDEGAIDSERCGVTAADQACDVLLKRLLISLRQGHIVLYADESTFPLFETNATLCRMQVRQDDEGLICTCETVPCCPTRSEGSYFCLCSEALCLIHVTNLA